MTIEDVIRRIGEIGIVPVVRAAAVDEATRAVEAICAGGIPIVEITMTVPDAITVIRQVARQYGKDVLLGAGTVTTAHQAEQCIAAGAEFIVSPGLSFPVLAAAQACGKLAIPGALTPTELMNAQQNGAKLIKIFPCGNVGGPKYLKSLRGPFPDRPDSYRRSKCCKRRRVYCRWSFCSRRRRGVSQRGSTARGKFGQDRASRPRVDWRSPYRARVDPRKDKPTKDKPAAVDPADHKTHFFNRETPYLRAAR